MGWILCEGIDKTGKTTVAEIYRKKGYEIVHLSAPDKKYQDEYYVGPSYLDEIMEMLMEHDGKNVFWDRTWFGEKVWPHIYGRNPCLSDEDFEIIKDYEIRNTASKILMIDPNIDSHWQRCVENNEPLNRRQFNLANNLYSQLAHSSGFIPRTLGDFDEKYAGDKGEDNTLEQEVKEESVVKKRDSESVVNDSGTVDKDKDISNNKTEAQLRLEKANAISKVLGKKIIKGNGDIYESIEDEVRIFLNGRLSELMGTPNNSMLNSEEVEILKVLCRQFKSKLEHKK